MERGTSADSGEIGLRRLLSHVFFPPLVSDPSAMEKPAFEPIIIMTSRRTQEEPLMNSPRGSAATMALWRTLRKRITMNEH